MFLIAYRAPSRTSSNWKRLDEYLSQPPNDTFLRVTDQVSKLSSRLIVRKDMKDGFDVLPMFLKEDVEALMRRRRFVISGKGTKVPALSLAELWTVGVRTERVEFYPRLAALVKASDLGVFV